MTAAPAPVAQAGSEAPHRVTAEDGSRFYWFTNPATGGEEQFWSVTTALSAKAKDGLKFWSAGLAAERAMDSLPAMMYAQRLDDCGNARSKTTAGCGQCPECVRVSIERVHIGESSRRAIEGSAIHNALEWWIAWGTWLNAAEVANQDQKLIEAYPGRLTEALPPYLEQLARWAAEYAIEPLDFLASEMTVYNTEHRFAGTLDAILRLTVRNKKSARLASRLLGRPVYAGDTATVVVDCKSREGEYRKGEQSTKKLYDEHALQLAAYRSADLCMPSKVDRLIKKMIPTDGAVVLQIRPDGYSFEPVLSGPEELEGFLGFLTGFRWTVERGPASIAVKTFPVVGDGKGGFYLDGRPADPPTLPVVRGGGACAGCGRMDPKRRTSKCQAAKTAGGSCLLERAGVNTDIEVRSTIGMPPQTTSPAPATRSRGATLDSIARSRTPGAMLTDEDIPF